MDGCDAVINAVGLYVERHAETFEAVHELGALNVAHQCATLRIDRLVHVSGVGAFGTELRLNGKCGAVYC